MLSHNIEAYVLGYHLCEVSIALSIEKCKIEISSNPKDVIRCFNSHLDIELYLRLDDEMEVCDPLERESYNFPPHLRPQIQLHPKSIVIKKGVSSGLLCQAKLKNADGKWGTLQPSQERALSKYRDFYSFVLYSYKNEIRSLLNPIHWKVCKDNTKSAIIKSFKADEFDKLENVSNILESLGQSKIGTTDDKIIKEIISPGKKQVLEIKIFKPDDEDPGDEIKISVDICYNLTGKNNTSRRIKWRQ